MASVRRPWRRLAPHHLILGLILLAGAALRYYGLNWDAGSGLHPDERYIAGLVQGLSLPTSWAQFITPGSPLEPGHANQPGFNYGTLPIYLYWIVGHFAAWLGGWVPGLSGWQDALGGGIFATGRAVSAAMGVLTIWVVYLIGQRLYSRAASLLAAAFFAVCVLDVQLSHFLTVDTSVTFFATLAVYWCVRLAQDRRPSDFLWAGACVGAALSSKVSVAALPLLLVVAPFLRGEGPADEADSETMGGRPEAGGPRGHDGGRLEAGGPRAAGGWLGIGAPVEAEAAGARRSSAAAAALAAPWRYLGYIGWLIAAVGALVVVFFVTQPYALIDMQQFITNVREQSNLALGNAHIFFTDKFYNTPAYWYHIEHIVPWDLGWPLGLAALAGLLAATWRSIVRRRRGEAVLLLWTLGYFASTGGQFMKYVRYMLPIMPALCLLAAGLLLPAVAWSVGSKRKRSGARAPGSTGILPVPVAGDAGTPIIDRSHVPNAARMRLPRWRSALALGILALTVLYALAYDNIYSTPNTRLAASLWFEQHVPPGTPYTTEGNLDEPIPWSFAGHPAVGYNGTGIATSSGGDTLQTWTGGVIDGVPAPGSIAAQLADAQYVTISSVRILGTVPHLPQAFPYSSRYYCLLFGQQSPPGLSCPKETAPAPLGFKLVAYFSNHPHLLGIMLNDYPADQNFSEYDHPPVWIFKRVRPVSAQQTAALITDNWRVHDVPAVAAPDKPLTLTPKEIAANNAGPSYAQEFPAGSLPMRFPALIWLLWVEALGLLALPLSLRLFRRLPDRGVVLAKVIGLLLTAYLAWIASSLHLLRFTHLTILGAAVVVGAASLLWGAPLGEVRRFWREKRGLIETVELVFLAGFVADVIVRMIYPDLWHGWNGGEKPMDFSYLNGMVRSQTMPPSDPWFAGGYMNYYYYGYFLVATLIKLTGIAPSVAYNLAVPTFFALTLAAAYTVGYALTRRKGLGLLAAGLTALAGNLYIGVQVGAALISLSPLQLSVPVLGGVVGALGGLWQLLTQQLLLHHQVFPAISFRGGNGWGWDSTRVIDNTINEFPFFTFLYADLHAHLMDMPALLACVALAANAALGARPWLAGARREIGRAVLPGSGLVMLLATAVVVGTTGPANTWDVITALLLVALGVAVSAYAAGRGLGFALLSAAVCGGVLGALALGLFYPFYHNLKSFYGTIGVTLAHTQLNQFLMIWGLFLFILTSYLGVEFWRGATAAWLRRQARAGEFVLYYWPRRASALELLRAVAVQQYESGRNVTPPWLSLGALAAGLALALLALALSAPVLALLALLLGVALAVLLEPATACLDRARRFTLLLTTVALGITAACEIVYLADFLAGGAAYRMNTVFKLYEQAWPLFAIASAAALAVLLRPVRFTLPGPRLTPALGIVAAPARPYVGRERTDVGAPDRSARAGTLRRVWLAALGLLLVAAALYPLLETPLHLSERPTSTYWSAIGNPTLAPTLDGTAFVAKAFPAEYQALTWLNDHVQGDPTVLSSDQGGYESFAFRVQWMTGLPNLVQGNWEQAQQRYSGQPDTARWPYAPYPDEVGQRHADVTTIYATTDAATALALLHKYHVAYIYVGVAERGEKGPSPASGCFTPATAPSPPPECVGYPPAGLAKFDQMARAGTLKVAYSVGRVTIYKVMK